MENRRRTLFWALMAVVTALPAALGVEVLLRRALAFSLTEVHVDLAAGATRAAWVLVGVTLVAGWGAWLLQRWLKRRLAVRPGGASLTEELQWLMISASLVQLAPLGAVAAYFLGAELLPVVVAIGVATVAVLALWFAK